MGEKFIPESVVNPESKETKELRAATLKGILKWMNRFEQAWQAKKLPEVKLPVSLRLGAFFVPATVIGLSTGCEGNIIQAAQQNGWEIVDCSEDEDVYIDTAFDWIVEHPENIQTQMDLLWPNTKLNIFQMINSLKAADILCGYQKIDDEALAVTFRDYNTIIIDINQTGFVNDLENFNKDSWVKDCEIDDLVNEAIKTQDFENLQDVSLYYFHLSMTTRNLLHETGHLAYDLSHTEDPHKDDTPRDAIDAWGDAAQEATIDFGNQPYQDAKSTIRKNE